MKAIAIDGKRMRHYADSAQQRNGQAWFVPDTYERPVALVCPVVRISRLGTHISQKFAGRYYDSVAAACVFMPESQAADPLSADETCFVRDAAYCVGEFVPVGGNDEPHCIAVGDERVEFSAAECGINDAICELSRISTLKMGDLIVFIACARAVKLAENDRLDVTIDGKSSVELRIK